MGFGRFRPRGHGVRDRHQRAFRQRRITFQNHDTVMDSPWDLHPAILRHLSRRNKSRSCVVEDELPLVRGQLSVVRCVFHEPRVVAPLKLFERPASCISANSGLPGLIQDISRAELVQLDLDDDTCHHRSKTVALCRSKIAALMDSESVPEGISSPRMGTGSYGSGRQPPITDDAQTLGSSQDPGIDGVSDLTLATTIHTNPKRQRGLP